MRRAFFGFIVACGLAESSFAATLTVDLNGGADYTDIQSAIDAAADGDTVLVKPGEYVITEPIDFNRLHNPDDPASPPVKNIVVQSEGGAEVTTIRMSETPANPDRASVVAFENWEESTSVLEGLTLTGGQGVFIPEDSTTRGGGVYCAEGSSLSLKNCTISGNSAVYGGGGVYCANNASPTLTNCTISGNAGSGVYCSPRSSPLIVRCTISGNHTQCDPSAESCPGGGVYCGGSSPRIEDCAIAGNSAVYGGGVYCWGSSPTLTNCTIAGNSAVYGGGGVDCESGSSPTLTNCTIFGNSAHRHGGGVDCADSSPSLTNCTIAGNSAGYYGGGVSCFGGSPILTNCTISGNSAGAVHCWGSSPTLTNCIVWDNQGGSISEEPDPPSNPIVSYCSIHGDPIWSGEGNINIDPRFIQPGHWDDSGTPDDTSDDKWIHGDYRIQPGSPCIDAGTSEGAPMTDIEGNGRPCGAGVDIGAYEFGDCWPFVRGDSNTDGTFDISDPVATLGFLFLGTKAPDCLDAADSNDSGVVDLSDAVYSLQFLFIGGPAPESPFPACGIDPVIDELDCQSYPACQ